MLKVRETKKSYIVENDGFNDKLNAYIQNARVYKVIIPKKDINQPVNSDWLEMMALDVCDRVHYTYPKGCHVMYNHRID